LRMMQLVVEAALRPFHRAGMVVLNESILNTKLRKPRMAIRLHKKAARIAEYLRAQLKNT